MTAAFVQPKHAAVYIYSNKELSTDGMHPYGCVFYRQ